jgi:hypothetical protein
MSAVEKMEQTNVVPMVQQAANPMMIIQSAIEKGASVETLEKLMALQERFEANEAKKEFALAMAAAKSEIRPIIKKQRVSFETKAGETTSYQHESLDDISNVVDPILSRHGLSYRYRAAQSEGGIAVTCVIEHQRGHSEETTLSAFRDESGKKNAIQAVGSTATYLQRYTLKLALGLSTAKDTDGVPPEEPAKAIDAAQFRYLTDLIEEAVADEKKLLAYVKAESLETLTQKQFKDVEAALRRYMGNNPKTSKEVK